MQINRTSQAIGPPAPTLADGELHVWIADLDDGDTADGETRQLDQLSVDERERAARFLCARDGERWARSRTLLRVLLAGYLRADPAELCFALGEHGKPELASAATAAGRRSGGDPELHFNLSHSGGVGLYAFALDGPVGVDVETPGRDIDVLAVARRALGEAVAEQLRRLEGERREREFLRAWVRHEARLKCLGAGLGAGATDARDRERWTIDVDVGELATAALAAEREPAKVERRRLRAMF